MDDSSRWSSVKEYLKAESDRTLLLGEYNSHHIRTALKHFTISMSRYKFVAKLFRYKADINVLEVGCSEGLGGLMIAQETHLNNYLGIDQDEPAIIWAKRNFEQANIKYAVGNVFDYELEAGIYYDVVFSLDVIEHIEPALEDKFLFCLNKQLKKDGCAVIGTPNETMMPYASKASQLGHINLYTHDRLYRLMAKYYRNVFMFSMNDEVVSTGFEPMGCYIFAVGVGKME